MAEDSEKEIVSIFLVDDETSVLKAVSQSLEELPSAVTCFEDAAECLLFLETNPCDLLITDVNMPGMNGIELLKRVRQQRALLPVLVISGYGDIPMAVQVVKLGAADFVEKPLDETTFLPAVRKALLSGGGVLMQDYGLTRSEVRVLEYVVAGRTNKEIAETIGRSIRTVENHRHRLMAKMEVSSTAELVRFVLTQGFNPSSEGD